MSEPGFRDSHGLSVLLMVRRHTDAADVCPHLENRPESPDRLLRDTTTLDHPTGGAPEAHQQTPEP